MSNNSELVLTMAPITTKEGPGFPGSSCLVWVK